MFHLQLDLVTLTYSKMYNSKPTYSKRRLNIHAFRALFTLVPVREVCLAHTTLKTVLKSLVLAIDMFSVTCVFLFHPWVEFWAL